MEEEEKIDLHNKLCVNTELIKEKKLRKLLHKTESIQYKDEEHLNALKVAFVKDGWEIDKIFSKSVRMKRLKPIDIRFEDKVWTLFANLGFTVMNKGRDFEIAYNLSDKQQIDVLAKDDESILYIECKSSGKNGGVGDFKETLEAWASKKRGVENTLDKLFTNQSLKKKFLFFTEGVELGEVDEKRLKNINGVHFGEEKLKYYAQMFKQIGVAAKYQLLGEIFAGSDIPMLENRIPAIEGKMGGHRYYSFSIEPEKLLKLGFVLHRSKANDEMMPTYQRILKKNRLKQIKAFLEDEDKPGFFPNSVLININTNGRKLKWEAASTQVANAISKIGVLHLPKKYQSAYIIDGQHRIYGYSGSKYSKTNSIPVVAFLNLSGEEQVNLFMQINENQKAVPKTLRETLNSDLLWTSKIITEQFNALCSRIAIQLGERKGSPLFDKISIGEDIKVITPTSITQGIKKGNYLGKVKNNRIETLGTFYKGGDLEGLKDTFNKLYTFLSNSINYLKENLEEDFKLEKDSFLFVNKGITATIMILSDIVDEVEATENIVFSKNINSGNMSEVYKYLDELIAFIKEIDSETKNKLKILKGAGAPVKYWRKFQERIHKRYPNFNPKGLSEYLINEERALNSQTYEMIKDIEIYFNTDFKDKLFNHYSDEWAWKKGVPEKIQDSIVPLMAKKNRERTKDEETDEWDSLNLIHYREIAAKNWQITNEDRSKTKFFEIDYTRPGDEKITKREDRTKWFIDLNTIRNIVSHTTSDQVSLDQYDFVEHLHDWIIKKKIRNKFQTG
jgi:DNA sulfur modification protein DndB